MKISTINIALAFIFAVAFSACTQEDSPLNDNSLAAYELSMEEIQVNTKYVQVMMADQSAYPCESVIVSDKDQVQAFLPRLSADEIEGEVVAEVIFVNPSDQQKGATIIQRKDGAMILKFDQEYFETTLTQDRLAETMETNCDQPINPTVSSSNSNMAEAAPEEAPKDEEKSKDLSSANHTQHN